TSFTRFVRATKDINIFVSVPDQATADLATSVLRRGVDPRVVVEAAFFAVKPTTLDKSDEFNLGVIGGVAATSDRSVALAKIVAGGLPTGALDVAVNDLAAQRFGVGPGDQLHMVGYTPAALEACSANPSGCVTDVDLGDVTVSGVLREPSDISPEASGSLSIEVSPSLTKSWLPLVATQGWLSGAYVESSSTRASLGAALTTAIGPDRISGPSADVFLDANSEDDPERVQGALDVEHNGLLILGLLACLAGLIAVPQALARHRATAASEDAPLRALGWTRRNQRRADAIWSASLGLAAAAVAVAAAIAMSPLFPIGLARRAEPSPGIDADWFVLSVGAVLAVVVLLGAGTLVNNGRSHSQAQNPGRLARLFSSSRPVPATAGRFLLDSGRVSAVARTTLTAAALGVAMIACAATVIRSQDYLINRPQLYGAPWDLQGAVPGEAPDPAALAALNANAGVAASALLTGGRLDADGQSIGAVAVDHLKGSIEPTMLTGRTILHDGEIVLGPAFMHGHHLSVGDSLAVRTSGTPGTLTIVGTGVPVSVGSYSSDVGAIMTPADFERYGTPSTIENEGGLEIAVRLAPGADIAAVRGDMAPITGGFERVIGESFRPARILNFGRVRSVPQIVEAFAALLTLLVLLHSLATVASRRRHDLSVLRAIGMRPKQARRVLWWHGGILAAMAVAIGLPLGVVGGRLLWHAVTDSIDSVYSPRSPWAVLIVVACGVLMISIVSGAALSHRAVPHPIARSLRSE
ncbi:MAG: putative transport system permease protein, partial [Ilumatobacteraceae bacterium]